MQPLNHTESFLQEIKTVTEWKLLNPDKDPPCNPCCIGVARVDDMLAEIEEAQLSLEQRTSRDWVVATPNANSVNAAKSRIKIDSLYSTGNIHTPRSIRLHNNKYYVANYYGVGIYDADLNYEGKWGNYGGSVTATSDNYDHYIGSIDFNPDGRVMLAMQGHHIIRVFTGLGQRLFDIGVFDAGGFCDQGKLYNPISAFWLPNGNILVSAYNGNDTTANGHNGHVSLYNGQTGAYIRTVFKGLADSNRQMGQGYVYNPYSMRIIGDRIYVMDYSHARIGVLDIRTLELLDLINPPAEFGALELNMNVMGVALDYANNELLLAGYATNSIIALDATTYRYKWHIKNGNANWRNPLQHANPTWLEVMPNGDLLVADVGFHRIIRVPRTPTLPVAFDAVFGSQYRIEPTALPSNYRVVGGQLVGDIGLDVLDKAPSQVVPLVGR